MSTTNTKGHSVIAGFVRVKIKVSEKLVKIIWAKEVARNGKMRAFREYTKVDCEKTRNLYLGAASDIIEVLPAVYNLHYDELELAE